eukprot:gene1455-biopygen259
MSGPCCFPPHIRTWTGPTCSRWAKRCSPDTCQHARRSIRRAGLPLCAPNELRGAATVRSANFEGMLSPQPDAKWRTRAQHAATLVLRVAGCRIISRVRASQLFERPAAPRTPPSTGGPATSQGQPRGGRWRASTSAGRNNAACMRSLIPSYGPRPVHAAGLRFSQGAAAGVARRLPHRHAARHQEPLARGGGAGPRWNLRERCSARGGLIAAGGDPGRGRAHIFGKIGLRHTPTSP